MWYFLYLVFLGSLVFYYYSFTFFKHEVFISPLSKGNSISNNDIEGKLKDAGIPISEIKSNSDSSYEVTYLGGKITISSKKNIDTQISSLQRILRELTIKGKGFKTIDFRFEKPIVEFN